MTAQLWVQSRRPTVSITAGSNIQTALDAGVAGTTFLLGSGTHRITTALNPQANQRLIGAPGGGAVISGSLVLSSWTASGSDFWATRAAGTLGSQADADCSISGCRNRNDVFYNGTPLVRVTTQAALATGKFYEDFAAGRVYIRDNPSGATVEQAVASALVSSSNAGIRLSNLVLQHAANAAQTGAIAVGGNDWLIDHCDIRYNHGVGVYTTGDRALVTRCLIHHQMQLGASGTGDNVTFSYNDIYNNNRDGSYSYGWEAGGSKWALSQHLTVANNVARSNTGPGLWCDIDNGHVIVEDNFAFSNAHNGIFYEISFGEATSGDGNRTHIRRNVSYDNTPNSDTGFFSGCQILVSSSRDVSVYGNTARGRDGIGAISQARGGTDPRGSYQVRGLRVYDNDVETTFNNTGGFGMIGGLACDDATQTGSIWSTWGNRHGHSDDGAGNRWNTPNAFPNNRWTWNGTDFITFATWQGASQDTTGSRTVGGTVTIPSTPTLNAGPQ